MKTKLYFFASTVSIWGPRFFSLKNSNWEFRRFEPYQTVQWSRELPRDDLDVPPIGSRPLTFRWRFPFKEKINPRSYRTSPRDITAVISFPCLRARDSSLYVNLAKEGWGLFDISTWEQTEILLSAYESYSSRPGLLQEISNHRSYSDPRADSSNVQY